MATPDTADTAAANDAGQEPVTTGDGVFMPPEAKPSTSATDTVGDAGKAAIDAERQARKQAEKDAREANRRLKELEQQGLSETEKLKAQAEEGRTLAEKATGKLRRANLLGALTNEGYNGGRAKATAELLGRFVDYDDDDEPTNLKAAIKQAEKEYGQDTFRPTPAPATGFDGGARDTAPAQDFNALIRRAAGR
jgi:hypothetical protein